MTWNTSIWVLKHFWRVYELEELVGVVYKVLTILGYHCNKEKAFLKNISYSIFCDSYV